MLNTIIVCTKLSIMHFLYIWVWYEINYCMYFNFPQNFLVPPPNLGQTCFFQDFKISRIFTFLIRHNNTLPFLCIAFFLALSGVQLCIGPISYFCSPSVILSSRIHTVWKVVRRALIWETLRARSFKKINFSKLLLGSTCPSVAKRHSARKSCHGMIIATSF